MFEDAIDDIVRSSRADARRSAERTWLPALIRTIDGLLFELEELNLRGEARVPTRLRERCQVILSLVPETDVVELRPRQKIVPMMETLYLAQELVLRAKDPNRPAYGADGEEIDRTA